MLIIENCCLEQVPTVTQRRELNERLPKQPGAQCGKDGSSSLAQEAVVLQHLRMLMQQGDISRSHLDRSRSDSMQCWLANTAGVRRGFRRNPVESLVTGKELKPRANTLDMTRCNNQYCQ